MRKIRKSDIASHDHDLSLSYVKKMATRKISPAYYSVMISMRNRKVSGMSSSKDT